MQVDIEPAGEVLFEGEFSDEEFEEISRRSAQDVMKVTRASLATVVQTITDAAAETNEALCQLASRKSEGGSLSQAVVELSVKASAEGNVVVAKSSAEGGIKVTFTWDFT